jgi:nitrogen fixation protein NifU and related proteins
MGLKRQKRYSVPDLQDLYNQVILDHYRKPRNFYRLERANRQADGLNPFCGDTLTVFLLLEEGILREISFVGTGCAISIASASVMTESLKGKTEAEAKIAFDRFHQLLANSSEAAPDPPATPGDWGVFSTLREYPVRVKCATLAWQAMRAALEGRKETASTE